MNNILLSPHFCLDEFTKSSTAIKHGIQNNPPQEAVENLRRLCANTLEPLREELGLPVVITSEQIDYDQLILYPSFIHVSYVSRERNRRTILLGMHNGKLGYGKCSVQNALKIE